MTVRPLDYLRDLVTGHRCGGCESCPAAGVKTSRKLMLFGTPNVGKSVIFNHLTGAYAVVSNYPGTTVEVSRGRARLGDTLLDVVDTPGAYALAPLSEDESVAQDMLLDEGPDVILQVADAKNLNRMLVLTLQLLETGRPLLLDVNIIDEAERAGVAINVAALSVELGIPVVATAAARGLGLDRVRTLLMEASPAPSPLRVTYPDVIENALAQITPLLHYDYPIAPRAVALLLLQRDPGMWQRVRTHEAATVAEMEAVVTDLEAHLPHSPSFPIAVARQQLADRLVAHSLSRDVPPLRRSAAEVIGRLSMHPLVGIPILLAVVYFGLYLVVGKLGAGVLVDLLEGLFEQHINPAATAFIHHILPWPAVSSLFVGEFGVLTLGVRYAFAIVLPLVGSFFLMFALLEDSGYLPRLAILVDRMFKRIGLSGRAIIPLVLGLGCDTMATLVTRVLETRRERLIATFLLALAIPCSAQLGVILGLLSGHPLAMGIWAGVVIGVFLLSGFLAARLVPGRESRFYLEIPPLRVPTVRNVLTKTWNRMRWYALEVIPLFLLASVLLWIGELTRIFPVIVSWLTPLVRALGLPNQAADAFLFGFFRRDYGAARLFDIHSGGAISGIPLVVAMVTITLFIPCLAQFMVMQKERGWRTALTVSAIIFPFAFGVGYLLNIILVALQVTL